MQTRQSCQHSLPGSKPLTDALRFEEIIEFAETPDP